MTVKFVFNQPKLDVWVLCHQTYNLVSRCEEIAFAESGLTPQQHGVLMAMKYIKGSVTVTDVAHWLDRNTNSISTLVDRMEKDGLVKRVRDLRDRRSVRLITTRKGKEKFDQATKSGWKLIEKLLSSFSEEELKTFARLMGKLREKAFEELPPRKVMGEVHGDDQSYKRFLARLNEDD